MKKMFEVDESTHAPAVCGRAGEPTRFSRFIVDHNEIVPLLDECGFHGLLIKGAKENPCPNRIV